MAPLLIIRDLVKVLKNLLHRKCVLGTQCNLVQMQLKTLESVCYNLIFLYCFIEGFSCVFSILKFLLMLCYLCLIILIKIFLLFSILQTILQCNNDYIFFYIIILISLLIVNCFQTKKTQYIFNFRVFSPLLPTILLTIFLHSSDCFTS